jgi:hypothetical protein
MFSFPTSLPLSILCQNPPPGKLSVDRDFKIATEAGERNRATMQLVRNWCSHVRIKKFGGTGMIEQMTGLPIGNHGLECNHATAGGMYTWDLRDAALDFYDRNCVDQEAKRRRHPKPPESRSRARPAARGRSSKGLNRTSEGS